MSGSQFLDSYSTIIIPLLFGIGLSFLQTDMIFKKISILGAVLVTLGWLIFYFKADPKDENLYFPFILGVVILTYFIKLYKELSKFHNMFIINLLYFVSWIALGWSLTDNDLKDTKTHYIFIAIVSILVSTLYMLPRQKKIGNVFDLGLPLYIFGWTILSFTTVDTTANDLIIT